jgi:type II secretory pathway component PulJ
MRKNWTRSGEKGFSFLELLIVLGVFSFIVGGLFSVLQRSQTRYQFEQDVTEAQQAARTAVDLMEREIRLAGFPKLSYYDAALGYTANSSVISLGFVTTNSTDLIFEGDINEDGIVEVVEYRLNGTVLERSAVAKPGGGTAATPAFKTLAENVRTLSLTYFDSANNSTSTPASVKRVVVNLNLSTNKVDPENRRIRTVSATTSALAKNI